MRETVCHCWQLSPWSLVGISFRVLRRSEWYAACKNLYEVKTFLSRVAYSLKRPVWILMWWHKTVEREKVMMCLSAALRYRSFSNESYRTSFLFLKDFSPSAWWEFSAYTPLLRLSHFQSYLCHWPTHSFRGLLSPVSCLPLWPTHEVFRSCFKVWLVTKTPWEER